MTHIKINDNLYLATINGRVHDDKWNDRASKSITLEMDYETANALFVDGLVWSIVQEYRVATYDNETGEQNGTKPVTEEYDNSDYNMAGSITDNRNGTITVKMGKKTEYELAEQERTELQETLNILLGGEV